MSWSKVSLGDERKTWLVLPFSDLFEDGMIWSIWQGWTICRLRSAHIERTEVERKKWMTRRKRSRRRSILNVFDLMSEQVCSIFLQKVDFHYQRMQLVWFGVWCSLRTSVIQWKLTKRQYDATAIHMVHFLHFWPSIQRIERLDVLLRGFALIAWHVCWGKWHDGWWGIAMLLR